MRRCNGSADSTYLELVLASLRLGLGVKKIDRENLFIDIRQQFCPYGCHIQSPSRRHHEVLTHAGHLAAKEQHRRCQRNGKTYHVDSMYLVWRMRCDEGALLEVVLGESRRSSRRRSEEEEKEARLKSRSCEKLRVFAHRKFDGPKAVSVDGRRLASLFWFSGLCNYTSLF